MNREQFKTLLETLVRAAIQGIPLIGSSLDQLTFGYRDTGEFNKLKLAVEMLSEEVMRSANAHPDAIPALAPALADQLLASPTVVAVEQMLTESGGTVEKSSQELVLAFERSLQKRDEQFALALRRLENFLTRQQKEISRAVQQLASSEPERVDHLARLLARFEDATLRSQSWSRRELSELRAELSRLDPGPIVGPAEIFTRALHPVLRPIPELMLFVDTHEIIEYGVAPYRHAANLENLAITVMFSGWRKSRFFLASSTATELLRYLQRHSERLRDYKGLRSFLASRQPVENTDTFSLSIAASLTNPRRSPLARIGRLLQRRGVVPFPGTSADDPELRKITTRAAEAFNAIRPRHTGPNFVDAFALAQVIYLNERDPGSVRFVTSSKVFAGAAEAVVGREQARELLIAPLALITTHSLAGRSEVEHTDLAAATDAARLFPVLLRRLQEALERGRADELLDAAKESRDFRIRLGVFAPRVTSLFELIAHQTLVDWGIAPGDIQLVDHVQFEEAREQTNALLTELNDWFAPLEEAMLPFRHAAEQ